MRRSTLIALLIALAVAGWLASPHVGLEFRPAAQDEAGGAVPAAAQTASSDAAASENAAAITAVRTRVSTAEPVVPELTLNGRTEANRTVRVAAEVSGRVVELARQKGDTVASGERLVQLDRRDRDAALAEARATLAQRQIEADAATQLGERGFQTETRIAEAQAALELARYHLKRAEVVVEQTEIEAPFAGVLEEQPVEIGSFVDVGETVAAIVDLDPIIVVTDVPEASIGQLEQNDRAEIRLVDGSNHEGRVRYVARRANEETRTFRVEVEVANPEAAIPAGISTSLRIQLESLPAHAVSPGILVLADDGTLGVKAVDDESIVHFHPAEIIRAEAGQVWLAGLPERLELITVGQGFVTAGQTVEAVEEGAVAAIVEGPRVGSDEDDPAAAAASESGGGDRR